ncbi:hypothetical protein Acr_12g0002560 [Actinidia rufa]|uniref:Uncharacterized protein n=1 Tax=Actinidia rufa TaxID=165716 RepID=A0A7J0FGC3_9ERIC|nr:hypothetical protein Acr_12g0002560 [Actinidia rufa]
MNRRRSSLALVLKRLRLPSMGVSRYRRQANSYPIALGSGFLQLPLGIGHENLACEDNSSSKHHLSGLNGFYKALMLILQF